ncbi:MAG: hypothetical protein KGJ84_10410 [Elusimicrobia bacterium]|nr:hypothetical protein [Elusimicrobiota bacterium]
MRFSSLAALLLSPLLLRSASAMGMSGMYGSYPMTREASGTSWQPESTPHAGLHLMEGDWRVMIHGYADAIYDRQGGPRGADKNFGESMLMAMAQRPMGPGTFGLRGMVSPERRRTAATG